MQVTNFIFLWIIFWSKRKQGLQPISQKQNRAAFFTFSLFLYNYVFNHKFQYLGNFLGWQNNHPRTSLSQLKMLKPFKSLELEKDRSASRTLGTNNWAVKVSCWIRHDQSGGYSYVQQLTKSVLLGIIKLCSYFKANWS